MIGDTWVTTTMSSSTASGHSSSHAWRTRRPKASSDSPPSGTNAEVATPSPPQVGHGLDVGAVVGAVVDLCPPLVHGDGRPETRSRLAGPGQGAAHHPAGVPQHLGTARAPRPGGGPARRAARPSGRAAASLRSQRFDRDEPAAARRLRLLGSTTGRDRLLDPSMSSTSSMSSTLSAPLISGACPSAASGGWRRRAQSRPAISGRRQGCNATDAQGVAGSEAAADQAHERPPDGRGAEEGDRPQGHHPAPHGRFGPQLEGDVAQREERHRAGAYQQEDDGLDPRARGQGGRQHGHPEHAGRVDQPAGPCPRRPAATRPPTTAPRPMQAVRSP